ncbi:MAG: hypothetical protein ACRDH5_17450, partial [bacterium]
MSDEWAMRQLSKVDVHVKAARPRSADLFDLTNAMDITIVGIPDSAGQLSDVEKDTRRSDSVAFAAAVPGRSQWVHVIDPWGWQESAFGARRIAELDKAVEVGAVGALLPGDVGQRVTSPDGRTLMHDDDALRPILHELEASKRTLWLGPIDPIESWEAAPLERPDYETVVAARDRMVEREADLRMIGLRLLGHSDDLDRVARRLDRSANLAVALDGTMLDLMTRQPSKVVREFLLHYQDRVLYGSGGPDDVHSGLVAWSSASQITLAYLSRRDPVAVQGSDVEGLGLPAPALRRIFRENALRWVP